MTHKLVRCDHCGISYMFQSSGHPSPAYNNDRYCPSCFKQISLALENVPIVVEKRLKTIDDPIAVQESIELDKRVRDAYSLQGGSGAILSLVHRVIMGAAKTITYGMIDDETRRSFLKKPLKELLEFLPRARFDIIVIGQDGTAFAEFEYYVKENRWGYPWNDAERR